LHSQIFSTKAAWIDTKAKLRVKASSLRNTYTYTEKERGYTVYVPFARNPVAPGTKIVLFSRNLGMLSNSMRKEMRERRE
jgi:hypothetical protein